jgi:hypothetical protein
LTGSGYADRLTNHAGYHLISVGDSVGASHARPRHLVVIVVDGLSKAHAERFDSVRRLQAEGQCRVMRVGPITVSRPVYAQLSTGLEQDRAGSRNNHETSPLAAESIWQVARRSGRSVSAVSADPWWQQLFPDGFDRYEIVPDEGNAFERVVLADLTLVHPLYVDHAGHDYGAASPEYAASAARADREISAFLHKLDLKRDLVVLTSDHGHASYGGHGGPQPEIAEVLTCFAGPGVARRSSQGRMDALSFAPALALFGGLRFPGNLRALEDDLDVLFEISDPESMSADYLRDRRAAVQRVRARNEQVLGQWLGSGVPPSWSSFYARERRAQHLRLGLGSLLVCVALGLSLWRRGSSPRQAARFLVWAALVVVGTAAVYFVVRKSLDFTSINARWEFTIQSAAVCVLGSTAGVFVHRFLVGEQRRLIADQLTLVALAAASIALHVVAYGYPLGFPLPGPELLFLPFLAPMFLVAQSLVALVLLAALLRARRPKVADLASPAP